MCVCTINLLYKPVYCSTKVTQMRTLSMFTFYAQTNQTARTFYNNNWIKSRVRNANLGVLSANAFSILE